MTARINRSGRWIDAGLATCRCGRARCLLPTARLSSQIARGSTALERYRLLAALWHPFNEASE